MIQVPSPLSHLPLRKKKFVFWPPSFIYDFISSNLLFPRSNHSFCTPHYRNPATLLILPVYTCAKLPCSPDTETSQNKT